MKFLSDPLEGRVTPLNKKFLRRGGGENERKRLRKDSDYVHIWVDFRLEVLRNRYSLCQHET